MKYDPSCPCDHCKHIRYKEYVQKLFDEGYTFDWTDTGRTKKKKPWFSRREYTYKEQQRIEYVPDVYYPIPVCRWRRVDD